MSCLCWNVRGLGNMRTLRELEVVTWAQDPVAMFLAETWAEEARLLVYVPIWSLITAGLVLAGENGLSSFAVEELCSS